MKRFQKILSILILSVLFLLGCENSEEEFASFTLQEIGMLKLEDTETPRTYIVNSAEAENQVITIKNNEMNEQATSGVTETYDLENATVTEDEITIEYNGRVETFKRLSESVAENDDNIQYQYTDLSEPLE